MRTLWILLALAGVLFGLWLAPVAHDAWHVFRDPGVAAWDPYGAPNPIHRAEYPGAVVGDRFFVFGGFTGTELAASYRVDVYDPAADRWDSAADLPTNVTHNMTAVVGDDVWLVGGYVGDNPGVVTAETWILDTRAETWRTGPPLPSARAGGALVKHGDRLHYFGGFVDRQNVSGDHWALDLSDGDARWEPRAALPEPRGHLSGASLGGLVYGIGGQFGHDDWLRDVPYVHVYDPANDTWREVASLPRGRSHFEWATVVVDGRIVILGGRSVWQRSLFPPDVGGRETAVPDVSAYDPERDEWFELPGLRFGIQGAAAGIVGDTLVLTGGSASLAAHLLDDTYRLTLPLWE